jgi:Putative adipose-regulatory protein (Seipin)
MLSPHHYTASDGIPPYAYAALPKLNFRQRYDISVDLLVPFTSSNLLLGNFMTSLVLSTSSNKTLAHVRRPVCIASLSFYDVRGAHLPT